MGLHQPQLQAALDEFPFLCRRPSPFSSRPPSQGWTDPFLSSVYLWDQAEEGSLGTLLNSEEQILNSMFEACDPQRTGGRGRMGPGEHWVWERQGTIRGSNGDWELGSRREKHGLGPFLQVLQDKWVIVGSFRKKVDRAMESLQVRTVKGGKLGGH